jgi:hypothetical protein
MKYSCPIFGEVSDVCSFRQWEYCAYSGQNQWRYCEAREINEDAPEEDGGDGVMAYPDIPSP